MHVQTYHPETLTTAADTPELQEYTHVGKDPLADMNNIQFVFDVRKNQKHILLMQI